MARRKSVRGGRSRRLSERVRSPAGDSGGRRIGRRSSRGRGCLGWLNCGSAPTVGFYRRASLAVVDVAGQESDRQEDRRGDNRFFLQAVTSQVKSIARPVERQGNTP